MIEFRIRFLCIVVYIQCFIMIRTCLVMFTSIKISLKLMMITACISVFLEFIITLLSHLYILHHSSNKSSCMSELWVLIKLSFWLLLPFMLVFENLIHWFIFVCMILFWIKRWLRFRSGTEMLAASFHASITIIFTNILITTSRSYAIISCCQNRPSFEDLLRVRCLRYSMQPVPTVACFPRVWWCAIDWLTILRR